MFDSLFGSGVIGTVGSWLGHLGTLIAIMVIVGSCLKTMQINPPTDRLQILLQLISYYARFWFVWLLVWANVQLLSDNQIVYWLLIALSLLYLYMNWVEPNRLRVCHHPIQLTIAKPPYAHHLPSDVSSSSSAKIAVLSDIHIGIFSNQQQLPRLVKCINTLEVDAVIILGDWLYHAGADLMEQMMPLKSIDKPCYTVLSESDKRLSGGVEPTDFEKTDAEPTGFEPNHFVVSQVEQNKQNLATKHLINLLPSLGIQLLPEQGLKIADIEVIGIHDGSTTDLPRLIQPHSKAGHPLLLVTHDIKQLEANPRTLSDAKDNTLVIAGQTHGGQVNIPVLTPLMVRALTGNKLAAGLRKPRVAKKSANSNKPSKLYQVWVNTGIGMTGLPFRFNCPPTIDVLTINVKTSNE